MSYKLRSMSGLLAFDAAARHESLTLAAQELGRTQSAISQQVKQLEDQTGLTLFVRRPRKVILTREGHALADTVRDLIQTTEDRIWQLKNTHDENVIRITMVHSFAWKWLSPRLPRFNKMHPEYDVRFDASDTAHDLEAEGYDLGIRYGQGSLARDEAGGYDS
ncbi:MAG: LysR family transcriptional regulator, partial [Kordiimonas sp.]